MTRAGQLLQPDLHALRLQRIRQLYALRIRHQRIVGPVQNQKRRIVRADIMHRADRAGLGWVRVQTAPDQTGIRIRCRVELEDIADVRIVRRLLHHAAKISGSVIITNRLNPVGLRVVATNESKRSLSSRSAHQGG